MPVIAASKYTPPVWLKSAHAQTMFPVFFRKTRDIPFQRETIAAFDGDILDIDWVTRDNTRDIVIFSHGMEGNSRRKYIKGMAHVFLQAGFAVASRNFRGCSGRMNSLPPLYHSGQTEDLKRVVELCIERGYKRIILVGFSMGGNQTLKYLGEEGCALPHEVKGAVTFSVPCDLASCAKTLASPQNLVYMSYFLTTLREKVRAKHTQYPEKYPLKGLGRIRTFAAFDGRYTAPIHGFLSAEDYWQKASCLSFLPYIRRPALLVNALNDPFLARSCYPYEIAKQNPFLFLETPKEGGHVGFVSAGKAYRPYWSDLRALAFIKDVFGDSPLPDE